MSTLDILLERNKQFAANESATGKLLPHIETTLPNVKALIITCADMRVDPALILGIPLGEAAVFRNIGGRITPTAIEQIGLLGLIGQNTGKVPGNGGEFHIIVMQHTDCGITRLANDTAQLAHYFGVPENEVAHQHVLDPRKAVAQDVATLRALPPLPASWFISGLVYNVATGLIDVVVPAAPLRNE